MDKRILHQHLHKLDNKYTYTILGIASIPPGIRFLLLVAFPPEELPVSVYLSTAIGYMVGVILGSTLIAMIVYTISKRKLKTVSSVHEQERILRRARRNAVISIFMLYVLNILSAVGEFVQKYPNTV